jgi:nitrate reductase gamma subunit
MRVLGPLLAVVGLALLALLLTQGGGFRAFFGIVVPYAAIMIFLIGIVTRVVTWARSPVPFRIPTTCGQQSALPWIKPARLDNPATGAAAVGRMIFEVLFFRSLFRNTKSELRGEGKLAYSSTKYLWIAALAFHWSFLLIFLRHYRFFVEPVPGFVRTIQGVDGFFQIGVPMIYLTDIAFVVALTYLFLRRVFDPRLRHLSLAADYFPLFLLLGVALSGLLLRHFYKVDLLEVKKLTMNLASFRPAVPGGIGPLFYAHVLLVCTLVAYLPFSKLTHMAGVFLSPTRNLANSNRRIRHVNPWNPPIVGHTYKEWEAEFHDKLQAAGIPLDRE